MARTLRHRGPDHCDTWLDLGSEVGLAHNRLSIVDVSPTGNQPMHSHSGRYVIIFNGEIYNHRELRDCLDREGRGFDWKGHSDTETLLGAIEVWGLRPALERCVGMFALALWDKAERCLALARDRLGEKPLYYGRQSPGAPFLFASELKALAEHPSFTSEINRDSLALYLRSNYVPAPFSIYRGIFKLEPGCILTLSAKRQDAQVEEYWSSSRAVEEGALRQFDGSPEECVTELEQLLTRAVGRQMLADVPLGAFLSGGIDSSTIVAVMQKQSAVPVKTFSIGFEEEGFDEARHAARVARHLGTDHTELYVTSGEAIRVLPRLSQIYDEPFADSSQIPTYLVSTLARRQVKVALSGDGGDELFGGYDRYGLAAALWRRLAAIPRPIRRAAAATLTYMPAQMLSGAVAGAGRLLPEVSRIEGLGSKIQQRSALLASRSAMELYRGLISQWPDPGSIVIGAAEAPPRSYSTTFAEEALGTIEQMMALDTVSYLPDDILVKLDRASMAVSLETRVPLLDHHVVEFAWRVPFEYKVRDGKTKWLLRQLLYRHVPCELVERPKMGFGVPIGKWLKGPLRGWAEMLLDERRLRDEGFFRPGPIRRIWNAHLDGGAGQEHRLWTVLMFQAWLERGRSRDAAACDFAARGDRPSARLSIA